MTLWAPGARMAWLCRSPVVEGWSPVVEGRVMAGQVLGAVSLGGARVLGGVVRRGLRLVS